MAQQTVNFPPWYFIQAPGEYHDVFGTVSAPASSTSNIVVSYNNPQNQLAMILGVAFEAGQLTNWVWGTWHLKIGDSLHPYLNNVQGMVSRINEPLSIWKIIKPGQRVQLIVDNANSAAAFQYGGRLFLYSQEKSIPLGPGVTGPDMERRT